MEEKYGEKVLEEIECYFKNLHAMELLSENQHLLQRIRELKALEGDSRIVSKDRVNTFTTLENNFIQLI